MKKLSIKIRVTLWYSIFMIILVSVVLAFMIAISNNVVESNVKKALTKTVNKAMDDVDYEKGELKIDNDLDLFNDGVYMIICDENKSIIQSEIPSGFDNELELNDKETRKTYINGELYYVYDREINFKKHDPLWIRGIVPAEGAISVINILVKISIIALPFIVILAAAGGYVITKRSFESIEKMRRAADNINEGKDLSKRIALGDGDDEILKLGKTFDRMLERLEESFENETQFTSDASHELRTPVSVILAQCEYMLENDNLEISQKDEVEVIKRQAKRMSQLISQLLTFSRLDRGMNKDNFESFDISELAEIICEEALDTHNRNIELTWNIEENIYAYGDLSLITRLFSNLINNAFQYGKEGGFVKVELNEEKNNIIFTVTDNGIGIAREEQNKIWNRFYQVNKSRSSDKNNSMGLGLSMVKWIAQFHEGSIKVESELGEGSRFIFSMPKNKR